VPDAFEDERDLVERRRPFMTARWSNPILLTYRVSPEFLKGRVHPDLTLDPWQGHYHVSLVAFEFQDTRIRGRRIPGFVNFSQLNLRAYVRQGDQRGVTYLKEFVASKVVATIAKLRFNEPYQTLDITTQTRSSGDALHIDHRWHRHDVDQFIEVTASQASAIPPEDGGVYHFTEHHWGYGSTRSGVLVRYRVEHPVWAIREIRSVAHSIDFASLFGVEWGMLNDHDPVRVTLAVGSAVELYPPGR